MPNLSDASSRVGCNLSDASSPVGCNLWMVLENILLTLLLASIPSFSLMQCVLSAGGPASMSERVGMYWMSERVGMYWANESSSLVKIRFIFSNLTGQLNLSGTI